MLESDASAARPSSSSALSIHSFSRRATRLALSAACCSDRLPSLRSVYAPGAVRRPGRHRGELARVLEARMLYFVPIANSDPRYFRATLFSLFFDHSDSCTASKRSPAVCGSRLPDAASACRPHAEWSGLSRASRVCIVIVAVIRLMQSSRTRFADARPDDWYSRYLARLNAWHFTGVLRPDSALFVSRRSFHSTILSVPDTLQAQQRFWRRRHDRCCSRPTWLQSPSWPILRAPGLILFDKSAITAVPHLASSRRPADPVAALIAVRICLRTRS